MKRKFLILLILLLLSSVSLFAEAIGGGFSYGLDTGTGAGAVFYFSIPQVPFTMVGVNAHFDTKGGTSYIGISDDYWFFHDHLSGIFKIYIGLGLYGGITTGGDEVEFDFGGRVPIGLQAFVLDPLEIFIDVAPTVGMQNGTFPAFGAQGSFGARLWF